MNRIGLMGLIFFGLTTILSAQIMNQYDVPSAPAMPQASAGIVPVLKVGAQTVTTLGYNLETGAVGLGYDTANANSQLNTMAYFDILFVDSRTTQPLVYEVGNNPDVWSAHFKIRNFTARLNTGNTPAGLELVAPSWLAELQGHGFSFGMLTQGGSEVHAAGGSSANPVIVLNGANQVLNLNAGSTYILQGGTSATPSPNSVAFYGSAANTSGILYAGYQVPGLFQAYVSALAQGDVNSATEGAAAAQGWAWAFNGQATPVGAVSEKQALAVTLKADAIKGFGFTNSTSTFAGATGAANLNQGDTAGFGLGAQVDWRLGKDLVVSPQAAFDARFNDTEYSTREDEVEWQTGGGLMLTLGPKKFVSDDWNELAPVAASLGSNKIQKFTYLQVLGMYSRATDTDLALRFEAPVGLNPFDPNLDTLVEYRVNNAAPVDKTTVTKWTLGGRLSYDFLDHSVVPYVRWSVNGTDLLTVDASSVVKTRLGVQLALIPGVGLEVAYLSPQIYDAGNQAKDAGKLEVITVFNTEGGAKTLTPKTMNFTDWKTP